MIYPMLDHLRLLSDVITGGVIVLGFGSVLLFFRLLTFKAVPVRVHRSA